MINNESGNNRDSRKHGGKDRPADAESFGRSGTVVNISGLSPEKRFILMLSDKQVRKLVKSARRGMIADKACPPASAEGCLATEFVLPEAARRRLEKAESSLSSFRDANERKWMDYAKQLSGMKYTVPSISQDASDEEVYRRLTKECRRLHLPEYFAKDITASVMEYIRTGYMRPILLTGPAGCGKTTGGKLLAGIIGLPHYLIPASRADQSNGVFGESPCFQSPDIGELAKGIIATGSPNLVYIIDEIEKAPVNPHRASVASDMLSVCDESCTEFRDNFLDFELPIHRSPIIMTCNDLDMVSEPLRDRCEVYRFYDVELPRMIEIIDEYAATRIANKYPEDLSVDTGMLHTYVEKLYGEGVRSIRRHQSLVEGVLHEAYCRLLDSGAPRPMDITEDIFRARLERILDSAGGNIGF